jgi:CubicO group peptidase (beta-lactamase class C family)
VPFAAAAFFAALPAVAADDWPTRDWPTASPESQGLDSVALAELLDHVRSRNLPLHSLLLVRRGHLVLDAAFYPYEPDRPHDVASVTKSVVSVLVGIAIDKGFLRSVDQPVASLLPGAAAAALDPRKQQLTVAHLLTMTSGLDCGFEPGEKQLAAMRRSEDWAAFSLALPMRAAPGARYAYCSCNNHLLSAVLSAQTGESMLAFARKHLFEPLGIRDVIWPADPKGRTHGWGDLHLFPRDLARIAYLYLRGGRWNGRQIVSEQWVRRSITPHVTVRDGVGYGYSWWLNTARQPPVFEAVGRGGQRAAVLPDEDLVVVFNAGGVDTDEVAPFLFRAIRSAVPLPDNASGSARLRKALAIARQPPEPHPPAPLPALALSTSGKRYVMDQNLLDLRAMTLVFDERGAARVTLDMGEDEWSVPVGLDGRYRFASTGPSGLPIGAMGRWSSEREFALDVNTVANINHFIIRIEFAGDRIQLTVDEATGEVKGLRLTGRPARTGSLPAAPRCGGPGRGRPRR